LSTLGAEVSLPRDDFSWERKAYPRTGQRLGRLSHWRVADGRRNSQEGRTLRARSSPQQTLAAAGKQFQLSRLLSSENSRLAQRRLSRVRHQLSFLSHPDYVAGV